MADQEKLNDVVEVEEVVDGIEIDDTVDTVVEDVEFNTEGLLPQEIAMAKEEGLIVEKEEVEEKDGEHKVDKEDESEDSEVEGEINTDPDNFDEMDKVFEKNTKKFHEKFTPNAKALYFKSKMDKKKRQEAVAEATELREKLDMLKDSSLSQKKLDKINKLLTEDQDSLTIEALQAVLNEKADVQDVVKPDTEAIERKVQERINFSDKLGKGRFEDFDTITKQAGEVFNAKPIYLKQFRSMLEDFSIDENEIVDFVADIAKLNKDYGKKTVDPKVKEEADRVLKNSKKKISSAAIGGSGKRIVSEANLTCDQASRLSPEKFAKLSEKTQKRILMGIDP